MLRVNNLIGFSGVASSASDPFIANVSLLFSFDVDFSNDGSFAGSFSAVNSAAVSGTQAKFGSKSLDMTPGSTGIGNGAYISTASAADLDQLGEFTEEMWVYITDLSSSFVFGGYKNSTGYFNLAHNSSGNIIVYKTGTGEILTSSSVTLSINTWHHVALTRDASDVLRVFVDGTVDPTTTTDATNVTATADYSFGGGGPLANGAKGYIDEYRRTEGVCRYTASFTAPSAAFPRT